MNNIISLVRPNIRKLKPYVSARSLCRSEGLLMMDANENPFGDGLDNRYPDPYQSELRSRVAERNNLDPARILFGNGSDELIDLLIRVFCEPGKDAISVCPPTFGMYETSADVNDVRVNKIFLREDYQLNTSELAASDAKICFLPCPTSPTGNSFEVSDIEKILRNFRGLVVLDEAYVDFSDAPSWANRLDEFSNLLVLQTFSKYWGLAGLRIGVMMASTEIIEVTNKIKPPYNLNSFSAGKALRALENEPKIRSRAETLISERDKLARILDALDFVKKVYPSQTNFLWVEVSDASGLLKRLRSQGIIVRGYESYPDFLRISVGTPQENQRLITALTNSLP